MKNSKIAVGAAAKLCALVLCLALIITQTACGANGKTSENAGVSKTGFFLDTLCTVTIFGVHDEQGELSAPTEEELSQNLLQLITEAFKVCDTYEKLLSKTVETSDIAKINAAGGEPVTVSEETIEVIQKGIEYGNRSDGAFDITIGKATDLWGFREAEAGEDSPSGMVGKVPDAEELAETMKHVDYKKIKIEGNTVQLKDPEMELDLGGIAKGYIADKVTEFLCENGVTSGVVDLGGNIVTIGGRAETLVNAEGEDRDFKVGIKDPLSESGDIIGTIPAKDKTIVTSGTYERYFEEAGIKYHHILDSKTGYPADTNILSVTIIADKGCSVDCDALSTSCLALGLDAGRKLIEETEGAEAIFVDSEGKVTTTSDEIGFARS